MDRRRIVVGGIDYSMSAPSLCIFSGEEFNLDNCKFYYITQTKKCQVKNSIFTGIPPIEYTSDEERYEKISNWVLSHLPKEIQLVGIEGYSMGSKGLITNICENCGVLKNKLYRAGIPVTVAAPTTIKKFGSGKGNSDKHQMYEAFYKETLFDMHRAIGTHQENKNISPTSDIIDSYYVCKWAYQQLDTQKK